MNFLNVAANRLTEKFDPNSAGFGGSGVIGNIQRDGMLGHSAYEPEQNATGIENAEATRAQEQMARSRGFQSYAQMIDWARQREQSRAPQTVAKGAAPEGGARGPSIQQGMAIHPKNMLEYITRMFNSATGQGQ